MLNTMAIYKTHGDGHFNKEDFKEIKENVIFEEGVRVWHPENIKIGKDVYIGHDTHLKGYYKNEMEIGDGTWIGQMCFFHSAGGIKIGKKVGIGPGVKILTATHKLNMDPDIPLIDREQDFFEVVIEDFVDIGVNTIILPGVRIGKGSMIGAGSVVTKDVEPYSVMAGNPARLLRKFK